MLLNKQILLPIQNAGGQTSSAFPTYDRIQSITWLTRANTLGKIGSTQAKGPKDTTPIRMYTSSESTNARGPENLNINNRRIYI